MATYFFETITDAQAATYSAATDTLVFQTTGESARLTTVRYNAATATSPATVTIISGITGRAVTFGPGVQGEGLAGTGPGVLFPDSSTLVVGTAGNDGPAAGDQQGSSTTDGLYGGDGNDTLQGLGGG